MNKAIKIKQAFNKAESSYDANNVLQLEVGNHLIELTKTYCKKHDYLIDIGCGTGSTTANLASSFRFHTLHAIDIADALLAKAKEKLSAKKNTYIYEADFNKPLGPEQAFDLVFSNMALHWGQNFNACLAELLKLMHSKSMLAFSIPLAGTLSQLKPQYALNPFFTMEKVLTDLKQHGLEIHHQQQKTHTLSFDNLFAALKSIKNVGANYTGRHQSKGLNGKSLLNIRLSQQLTYVIGYFITSLPHAD